LNWNTPDACLKLELRVTHWCADHGDISVDTKRGHLPSVQKCRGLLPSFNISMYLVDCICCLRINLEEFDFTVSPAFFNIQYLS